MLTQMKHRKNFCDCERKYEYAIVKYSYKRTTREKTDEEMFNEITNKSIYLLKEFNVPESKQVVSSSTLRIDSYCNIAVSSVHLKPYFRKFKMLYSSNKSNDIVLSIKKDSFLINEETMQHRE